MYTCFLYESFKFTVKKFKLSPIIPPEGKTSFTLLLEQVFFFCCP